MKNFRDKTIVVPWDFSKMCEQALVEALDIAQNPDQVRVIHVTPYPSAVEPSIVWGTYSEENIRNNLQKSFLEEVPTEKYPNVQFTALFGDPGSEITRFAKDVGAGLIVIPSHGRTGVKRFLLGSVAERVVRLAPCPVLVLRDEGGDD